VRPARILVIEDNPIRRRMVRVALEGRGYEVLEASGGREAAEALESRAPDLILQDLLLPDVERIDLVRRFRATEAGREIPILGFSGFHSTAEQEARASSAGFSEVLDKPFDADRLIQAVEEHLGERRSATQPSAGPGVGRRILLVDDDRVQLKLQAIRLRHLGFSVETVENGQEALEEATRNPPDAILSDVLLPGLDGFGLCLAVRRDPVLRRVPLVLTSSNYLDEADRRLGKQVGADAYVPRTADFQEVVDALLQSLERGPRPEPTEPMTVEDERYARVVRQLERQVAINANLSLRCSLQAAVLSMLSHLTQALAGREDIEGPLQEMLANLCDLSGLTIGNLHRVGPDGKLRFSTSWPAGAPDVFAGRESLLRSIVDGGRLAALPSSVSDAAEHDVLARADLRSALVAPLAFGEQRFGAITMGSTSVDLSGADWPAFAQTLGAHVSQSLALARLVAPTSS
jgi:CheY-like chemotaxis protein